MRTNKHLVFLFIIILFIFHGCATTGQRQPAVVGERPEEYQQFFTELDQVVDEYMVREASDFQVSGFPYLRTNRFLAIMKDRVNGDSQEIWVEWMRQMDLKARKKEISNLPEDGVTELTSRLPDVSNRQELLAKVTDYSEQTLAFDRRQTDFYDAVKSAVYITGEYSMTMRTFGLYPLASIPVSYATKKQYNIFRDWHQTPLESLPVDGNITVFTPVMHPVYSGQDITAIFATSRRNLLGLPDLSSNEIKALVLAYAPVIEQDVTGTFDLFGKVKWKNRHVKIAFENPTVYYYITYSLFKGEPVVQLNYAFWYSGRWGENSPGIERGPLDGVTLRITFDPDGRPAMVDIMNNCGCYHFYVPRKERVEKVLTSSDGLYPFVPAWLPDEFPRHRLGLRINSGWHQIQKVFAEAVPANTITYELRPYDVLEAVPHAGNGTESVFSPEGIMKDSSRIEPYIFFSMGIPKVGYMRQRGHHAIKLVGRAHFTDPDLFDNNFIFK